MEDSQNKRYGTRSAVAPAQSFDRSNIIKQELRNEGSFHRHAMESSMVDFQEASSSNCSSKDLLTDEIEVGETSLTFQDALFTIHEIKPEPIAADANDEIEDNDDVHESSSKRMKIDKDSGAKSHVSRKVRTSVFEMRSIKGTSSVWQHFEKMQNSGKCLYCAKVIRHSKGSLSNLKRHLHAKHAGIPLHRATYCSSNGETNSKTHEECCAAEQQSSSAISRPATRDPFFPAVKALPVDVQQINQDELLLQLICQESLPFSITDSEAFQNYSYGLNSNYIVPSRKTVSEAILPREYNKSLQRIKNALENTSKVALTLEGWTNINNTTFYALTAHYIDNNNVFRSSFLECSEFSFPHSERNMADWITKVTEQFNITSKVVALVTDNTRNMSSAAKELKVNHLPCFAYTLNQVVIKSIQNAIKTIVEEVIRVVAFFRNSSIATEKLYDVQNQLNYPNLKLKQGVATRWNSTYDMIERFFKNKIPLLSCLDSIKMKTSLKNNDWIVLEQTIKMLENFDCATKIASAEKLVTLSHMGLLVKVLIRKTTNLLNEELESSVRQLGNSLIQGLAERFDPLLRNMIVNQAMLLDPRMKLHSFENEGDRYKETYECVLDAIVPYHNLIAPATSYSQIQADKKENDHYRQHLFGDFASKITIGKEASDPKTKAKLELDEYIASGYVELGADPLAWWKQNQSRFPSLYKLVQSIFCIPATSVPCERVFSKCGQIYSEKRSRLDPKNLTELLFLQQNGF